MVVLFGTSTQDENWKAQDKVKKEGRNRTYIQDKNFRQTFNASFFSEENFFSLGQVSGQKKTYNILCSNTLGKSGPVKYRTIKTKKNTLKVCKNLKGSEEKENHLLTNIRTHKEIKSRRLLRVFLENVFCSLDQVTDQTKKTNKLKHTGKI